MIRPIQKEDIETVCNIVNDNWKLVYSGYVNENLLSKASCIERAKKLEADFSSGRLLSYIYEDYGKVIALLSIGDTADDDKIGAFEIWSIYILKTAQKQGIGSLLIEFAEEQALKHGYSEIVIWAFTKNIQAISFYEKHGYIKDKEEYLGFPYLASGTRFNKKII